MKRLNPMQRRLRISGILILMGLLSELASLLWVHPIGFILFLLVGGSFLVCGTLFFLYSLIAVSASPYRTSGEKE